MTAKEKKKKSLIRRIVKWTGITFLVLIIAMILIPIFFKDQIKELVLKEVNKSLLADVKLGDFDLTFISTFPNMTIQLDNVKISGRGEFKGVDLANIEQFSAHVGVWSVINGDKVKIDAIHLEKPIFDVRILSNGKANYDIVKPDSVKTPDDKQPSNFELKLQEYTISNAHVRYDDQQGDMFAELVNMTHVGSGDLTADVIDFNTKTTMDKMTFDMEGVSYLSEVKTDLGANILMEFTDKSSKFTLKENEMSLNALHFSVDGFYEMLKGYDNMDLKLNADKATFKDFLSLIPTFYQSGYESMIANGNLAFKGAIKGRMDAVNMPGWDFGLSVDKAKIKYPNLPGSIDNIVVKAGSKFAGGADMDKMTLDVPKFHADFVGNTLDATLKMRNPMTDPLIDSKIMAKVNLATLSKVIPMAEGESYNGKLDADVLLNGRMSALENENYEAFKATGSILLSNLLYKSKDISDAVSIKTMKLNFSPQNLALESLDAKMGKSDFQMAGTIDNYMKYMFPKEGENNLLKGDFSFNSTMIDLDELMGTSEAPAATEASAASTTPPPAASEPFLIPNNVDFNLNTSIATIKYNGLNIKNIKGGVNMKQEVASLDHLTMSAMGGSIGLNGKYDTHDHHRPTINFGYDLKEIDIQQLAENFVTIEKLAPIAKYTQGKISSKFSMKSALQPSMEPVYSSLTGSGDFFSKMVTISGFKPLEKIAEAMKMSKLAKQTVNDLKVAFKFSNGKVSLTPFNVKLGKIVTNISGSSSLEQDIDYKLKMNIPKEEIPSGMVKAIEDQIKKVNSVVPQLKISELPAIIPVDVLVGGKMTDPKVTTNFKEALASAFNVKDLKDQIKEQIKDTVKAVIDNKVKEVKEDLNAKKQQILDDAQKEADKVKAEAKKGANAVRAEADKQAKALLDEAGANPIKKKAAEVAGAKLKKTADEKANKIEKEADVKADAIMNKAREKADQVK